MNHKHNSGEQANLSELTARFHKALSTIDWCLLELYFINKKSLRNIEIEMQLCNALVKMRIKQALEKIFKNFNREVIKVEAVVNSFALDSSGNVSVADCMKELEGVSRSEFIILFEAISCKGERRFNRQNDLIIFL